MKALSGGRPSQLQITSAHTCGLADCEHSLDHHDSRTPSYLLSPTESCPMEHRRCSPHSSIHSECMAMPVSVSMANTDHSISSSTFPRMHYSSHHDSSVSRDSGGGGGGGGGGSRDRDECGSSHGGSGKMNRIPANLLDQFEKQLPLHRDGFHTLQYQKTHTTTTEQRNESPGRIRHLVHSVQKLFTKSHSLEGSSKMNGTKGDSHREGSHHHHPNHHGHHKHSKRSKSKERKSSDSSGKQRSGVAGWWSSDDNLDSDSTYRTPSIMSRQQVDHISHCYPDSVHSHYGDLSLKTSKSNNDVKCSACESVAMAPEGKFMKRSSWSTLTVSQAKEAYRKSSLNLEKPMTPTDLKPNLRPCHYLQVPQDEWSGYPGGGKDDEIPCRRMRSSSYVKAMGDEESGESDSSPKTSPVKTVRPDALVKSVMQRPLLDSQSSYRVDKMNSDVRNYITNFAADLSQNYHLQTSRDMHPHHRSMALEPSTNYKSQQPPLPAAQFRSRNQSYMRAVSTLSQASCVSQVSQVSETDINGQFESVCESVFSEVESQAVEALDLPGCFRTRSHSYLRAIQAGYSQDDDCIPTMTSSTVTSTIRSTTEGKYTQEATSLPEYQASVHRDVADTGPLAHDDLGCPIRRDRLYRQESIGATAKPQSGPPVSPRMFRPPKASVQAPERPSPKAIQASIKESAQLAATISMQWKEEVSAMRRELSDLRRDLCTELRAFNSNFNSFTQHYNTWSPQPGASGGTGAAGKQTKVAQLSVGTQARSKVLVRQSTADAAVNCPEEGEMQEKQAIVRRRLPKQISMDPAILRRPASLFVEGSIPITLDPLLVDPVTMIQPESVPVNSSNTVVCPEPLDQNTKRLSKLISPDGVSMSSSETQSVDPAIEDTLDSEQLYPKALCSPDPVPTDVANVYLEETDKLDPVNLNTSDTGSIDSLNVKPLVPEPRIMHLPYPVPEVTVSPPQESDSDLSASDSESVKDDTVRQKNPMSQDPVPVCLPDPEPLGPGPIVSTEPEIKPLSPTNVYSSEKLDQYSVTICPTVIVTPESPTDLEPLDVCLIPPDSESQDLATVCFPDLPDPIPLDLDIFSSEIVVHAYPVTIDSFDEFDDSLEPEWPPCPESEDQATYCPSDPFMVHLDLTTFNSSDESDLDSVFLDPPEPLETVSVSSSDLSPIAMYTPPEPVSLSPPSPDQTSIYQMESVSVDPAMEYRLDQMHEYLPTEFPEDPEPQDQVTVHSPGLVSFGLDSPFTPDSVALDPATMCHPEPVILGLDPLLLLQDPASISLSPFEMAPMEPEDATGEATDTSGMDVVEDPGDPEGETTPDNPGKSHCDQDFLWDRWQQKAPQWEPRSMKRSSSVELWSGRYEYNRIQFRLPSTCTIDRTTHETPAVTYTNNYKKTTPPPVPPRSTSGSKPLISVTAQSSTESTQDTYHEGRHPRGWGDGLGLSLGRALYNSTDSLDSAKAVTIAMEAAGLRSGKRHPSTDRHSHSSVITCDKAILVSKAEEYLKTPRSSIGIQVEAATDSDSESKGSKEYHSVGIQVEADRRGQGRLKRSNSVTASVQADMEMEGFPTMEDKGLQFGGGFLGGHSEPSTPTQYGVRTVRTQGLFSYREDYRTPTEPPCPQQTSNETTWQLEPPSPREPAESSGESGRTSPALLRDGSWFMQLLHAETKRMEGWCKEMEAEAEENDLSEDILGKIRSAVGSAQLLMSQKFQQFYWLCQQNLDPSAMPRPTSQDLAGFWDLLQLSIDDVTAKFNELQQIKNNDWRPVEKSPEKRLPPVAPKKSMIGKRGVTREKSLDLPDRHRLEARRRLMQAKRAASFRQNSVSERADSIEIYIPEAQTRL